VKVWEVKSGREEAAESIRRHRGSGFTPEKEERVFDQLYPRKKGGGEDPEKRGTPREPPLPAERAKTPCEPLPYNPPITELARRFEESDQTQRGGGSHRSTVQNTI